MDSDRFSGGAKELGGRVEAAAGKVTGDARTEADGNALQVEGVVQNIAGQAKDVVRDIAQGVSDVTSDAVKRTQGAVRGASDAVAAQFDDIPLTKVLAIAAVGFIVGYLFRASTSR